MAYDGWLEYAGSEFINLGRTAQLADAFGIDTVWVLPNTVDFIETDLAETGYGDIASAPWYDPGFPGSSEFAGIIPLSVSGLDDSTMTSTPVEYIVDGGHSGQSRNSTLPIVFNVALVASTERGAEYGLRWMNRRLRESDGTKCSGADLRYFRYANGGAPIAHRRDVRLTRGSSVTRKRVSDCSSTWMVTFTLTAGDPYEYGEPVTAVTALGSADGATGPLVTDSGVLTLTDQPCIGVNYDPIYDPLAPALVAPPAPPNLLPSGWVDETGNTFDRYWARIAAPEPSALNVVPVITLSTPTAGRMVRVAIWPSASATDDQCDPLFAAVLIYLPDVSTGELVLDGEQKVAYVWDGVSLYVRRADTLAYSPEAGPVEWTAMSDDDGFILTLDLFDGAGDGDIRVALDLVPKSD